MKRLSSRTRAIFETVLWLLAVIAIIGGVWIWTTVDPFPKPTRPFTFTGKFSEAYWGGNDFSPSADQFNFWKFQVYLSPEEAIRVTKVYTDPYKYQVSGPTNWPNFPPNQYEQETRGNWCGNLPAKGTPVRIESPTGFTRDITITDLASGQIYRSGSDCSRPVYTFNYRMKDGTSNIIEGKIRGFSKEEASINLPSGIYSIWKEGEPDPDE